MDRKLKNNIQMTDARQSTLSHKILHFPLTKIFIGLIVCLGTILLGQVAIRYGLEATSLDEEYKSLFGGIAVALLAVVSYHLLFRFYERRAITEISMKRLGRNLSFGILLGAALQSLTILVIYWLGGYHVEAINPVLFVVPALSMAFTSAITEEILVRGIIFRIMEEKLGSVIALIVSSLLFGVMHLGNPNSTLITALGLAIQAGLLLGAAYIWSRSLWFPIALHFAWNFVQSGIFGARTSGNAVDRSLLTSTFHGASWFTGGDFGPEGSIQATVFCLIAAITLLVLSKRQGRFIIPWWKTKTVL